MAQVKCSALRRRFLEGEYVPPEKKMAERPVPCRIPGCSGHVVAKHERVYLGDPMNMIIGPGSRHQMTDKTTYHCDNPECLVLYAGMPKLPAKRPRLKER